MKISVSDAKAQLTELVRLAEAGEDVVLTRHGVETVRLVRAKPAMDAKARRAFLEALRDEGAAKVLLARRQPGARIFSMARMVCRFDRGG